MREAFGLVLFVGLSEWASHVTPFAWSGWFLFFMASMGCVWLWHTSRVQRVMRLSGKLEHQEKEIKKMLRALADEKQRVIELTNRNDELKTQMNTLHGEYVELRGQFSQLNVAYSKLGDQVDKLREDLKAEREKRDEQFAQWIKEKAQNGDL